MTSTTSTTGTTPEQDAAQARQDWLDRRWATITAPHGTASLARTHWLTTTPEALAGAPGTWHRDGETVVGTGTGLADAPDGELRLAAGEERQHEGRLLRAFVRAGDVALRVLDPQAPTRTTLERVEAFDHDPAMRLVGAFTPAAQDARVAVRTVDGATLDAPAGGTVALSLGGEDVTLAVTPGGGDGWFAVLTDASTAEGTYRFRFLDLPPVGPDGTVVVDLNRAYLPPCAFSDEYVCPMPPPENRWTVPVRAGERRAVRTPSS